jgi:hypothetical protein
VLEVKVKEVENQVICELSGYGLGKPLYCKKCYVCQAFFVAVQS